MWPISGTFLMLVGAAGLIVVGLWAWRRLGNYFSELMDENSEEHGE